MPYVPRILFDVFISYAHASNDARAGGWVSQFKQDLEANLKGALAPAPQFWMDNSNLRTAGSYSADLQRAVRNSAVLVAVTSPPYFNSDWCTWERRKFRDAFGDDPRTKDGGRRIIEAVHRLMPDGTSMHVQRDSEGVRFCNAFGTPFPRGSASYVKALNRLTFEVNQILYSMRNAERSIFLSAPIDATESDSQFGPLYYKLRNELDQQYKVVPMPGVELSDGEFMASADLSVHFLSQKYDPPTISRIRLAKSAGRPLLVIVAADLKASDAMFDFLATLKHSVTSPASDSQTAPRFFRWIPGKHEPGNVLDCVEHVLDSPPLASRGTELSVYLICDPRDRHEDEVQRLININELLKTFATLKDPVLIKSSPEVQKAALPDDQLESLISFFQHVQNLPFSFTFPGSTQDSDEGVEDHLRKFAACDGLILLWGCAGEAWFKKYRDEVLNAPSFRHDRPPLHSKAVLIKPRGDSKVSFAKALFDDKDLWEGIDVSRVALFLRDLVSQRQEYDSRS